MCEPLFNGSLHFYLDFKPRLTGPLEKEGGGGGGGKRKGNV